MPQVPDTPFVDYYQLLDVAPDADWATIEKKIKEQQRKWRPVTGSSKLDRRQEAESRMALLAEARKALKDPAARAAYDRRRASRPRQPTAPVGGSDAYDPVERAEEALRGNDYERAKFFAEEASRATNSAHAWNLRARACLGVGEAHHALIAAQEAVGLEPDNPVYHVDLGGVHEALGNGREAIRSYEEAARLDPDDVTPRLMTVAVHVAMDETAKALRLVEQLHRERSDDPVVTTALASALLVHAESVPESRQESQEGTEYAVSSAEELEQMTRLVDRARALRGTDREVRREIEAMAAYLERVSQKVVDWRCVPRWRMSGSPAGFWTSVLIFLFLAGAVGAVTALANGSLLFVPLLLLAGLTGWAVKAVYHVPAWQQNRRIDKAEKILRRLESYR